MVWDQLTFIGSDTTFGCCYIFGHPVDAYVIIAITLINAVIGFAQEFKADNAVKALEKCYLQTVKLLETHGLKSFL